MRRHELLGEILISLCLLSPVILVGLVVLDFRYGSDTREPVTLISKNADNGRTEVVIRKSNGDVAVFSATAKIYYTATPDTKLYLNQRRAAITGVTYISLEVGQ